MELQPPGFHEAIDKPHVITQESPHQSGHYHPGKEIGDKEDSLIYFGGQFIPQLVNHQGQTDGQNNPQDDENQVVTESVSDDKPDIPVAEENSEIFQSHPFAVDDAVKETPGDTVFFEGNDDTKHREVAKKNIPDRSRENQYCQLAVIF
jgi:hypothetical protein